MTTCFSLAECTQHFISVTFHNAGPLMKKSSLNNLILFGIKTQEILCNIPIVQINWRVIHNFMHMNLHIRFNFWPFEILLKYIWIISVFIKLLIKINLCCYQFFPICSVFAPTQGCRWSFQTTYRPVSFRQPSTTLAANQKASLFAATTTAGVSAVWTSLSATALTLTWTLWKTACCT